MKARRFPIAALCMMVLSTTMIVGCKYDVAEPLWDKPVVPGSETPTITSIVPADSATAGVNTIMIYGTNFTNAIDTSTIHGASFDTTLVYNGIYFSSASTTVSPEIMEFSATSIKVRRPNLAADSCTVKIVPTNSLLTAKFGPYKIAQVSEKYGSFLDNVPLSVVTVDKSENVYVVYTNTFVVYQVTPGGVKTKLGSAARVPTDARVGPDGNVYLPGNNRSIEMVDVQNQTVKQWIQLPQGRIVKYGDFDANGYFYTAGTRSQLVIIAPNLSVIQTGLHGTDDIQGVRVYGGYVYLLVKAPTGTTPSLAIWRHSIDSVAISGRLGAAQLVLNLDGTLAASRTIKVFALSASGALYLGTDATDPLLVFDLNTSQMDYLYKGIVPPYCKYFCWGKGNYLYLISGNATPAQEWTVYRVNVGTAGAL
jgi:hypothetical protein